MNQIYAFLFIKFFIYISSTSLNRNLKTLLTFLTIFLTIRAVHVGTAALHFGNASFDTASNNKILNITIQYIPSTNWLDGPLI